MMAAFLSATEPEEAVKFNRMSAEENIEYIRTQRRKKCPFNKSTPDYYQLLLDKFNTIDFIRVKAAFEITQESDCESDEESPYEKLRTLLMMAKINNEMNLALSYKNYRDNEFYSRCLLLTYLSATEGAFSISCSILSTLLFASGITYLVNGKEKKDFKGNLPSFMNESLGCKIKYLHPKGFGQYTSSCDKILRNAVGHSDFVVYPDGSVRYYDLKEIPTNPFIDKCNGRLLNRDQLAQTTWDFIHVNNSMNDAINRFFNYKLGMHNKQRHPDIV